MKKKYLFLFVLLIIFASLSIVLGYNIFIYITYVPRAEIINSDIDNGIHNGVNKGMHLETENL